MTALQFFGLTMVMYSVMLFVTSHFVKQQFDQAYFLYGATIFGIAATVVGILT